jgi:biopolymer transport protein ExbD
MNMKTILMLLVGLAVVGCSRQNDPQAETEPAGPIVKLSVLQSGKILIEGTESTIAQVEQRLTKLKSEGGMVWYYREAGQQEPPPEAMQVIKLVVDNGLPVSLSSKPDFSDYVGEDGQTHQRE